MLNETQGVCTAVTPIPNTNTDLGVHRIYDNIGKSNQLEAAFELNMNVKFRKKIRMYAASAV